MARRTYRSKARTYKRRTKPATRRASNAGRPWTREEIQFMRKYYRNNETAWVARQLGRTVYSVRYKASDLSIKKAAPSVWRGNTGVTKVTRKAKRRSTKRTSWSAKTRRTARLSKRRSTARRSTRRR